MKIYWKKFILNHSHLESIRLTNLMSLSKSFSNERISIWNSPLLKEIDFRNHSTLEGIWLKKLISLPKELDFQNHFHLEHISLFSTICGSKLTTKIKWKIDSTLRLFLYYLFIVVSVSITGCEAEIQFASKVDSLCVRTNFLWGITAFVFFLFKYWSCSIVPEIKNLKKKNEKKEKKKKR